MGETNIPEDGSFRPSRLCGRGAEYASSVVSAAWCEAALVVAVDADGHEIASVSRDAAHSGKGILHQAFMTLLADAEGRLLLARRSEHKRLWPMVWADSCAGHPRPHESVLEAAQRRATQELGCSVRLHTAGSFTYCARMGDLGVERELCHVMLGHAMGELRPNPAEVSEIIFVEERVLRGAIERCADAFAPWLTACLQAFPAPLSRTWDAQV